MSTPTSTFETVGIISKSHCSQLRVMIVRQPKQPPHLAVQRWERSLRGAFTYRHGAAGIPAHLADKVADLLVQGRALIQGGAS